MGLKLQCPPAVVVKQNGHIGYGACPFQLRREDLQLFADLLGFDIAHGFAPGVVEQAAVILLVAAKRLPPAEVDNAVRAVTDALVGLQPHEVRAGQRVVDAPIDRTGLLFHHPKVTLEHTPSVIVGGGHQPRRGAVKVVVVPAYKIELAAEIVVVDVCEEEHQVVGDKVIGAEAAEGFDLIVVVGRPRVAAEAEKVEFVAGVAPSGRDCRQRDLAPIGVDFSPKRCTPVLVEHL